MKNNILILAINKFPNEDAGSVRQYIFSKIFKLIGLEPFVIGMGKCTKFSKKEYNSISYMSFRSDKNDLFHRIIGLLNYKRRLKLFLNENKNIYKRILVIDIPCTALFFIKKYARKNNIQLYHDSVEWYSPEQFKYHKLSISYILKELYNTCWIDERFNVISISKYLELHFIKRKCNTIRIPAILDVTNMPFEKHINSEKLTIVYAGSPGKKDYLKEIIEGINLLDDTSLRKVELRIIGATKEQVKINARINEQTIRRLQDVIIYKGRLPREDVLKNLEEADFTVLMRSPTQRYAKAGFPTKIVESLASGTPVICNITSDLGDYIRDGKNGIIVEACTAEAFLKAIKSALNSTFEQRKIMYGNARKTAEENFDYRRYTEKINNFLDNNRES